MKKRIISALLTAVLASSLTGCGQSAINETAEQAPAEKSAVVQESIQQDTSVDTPQPGPQIMPEFDQASFDEQYEAWKQLSDKRANVDNQSPEWREITWQMRDMEKAMYGPYAGTNLDGAISEDEWEGSFMAYKYASDPSYAEQIVDYAEFPENLKEGETITVFGKPLTVTKVYYEDKFDKDRVSSYYAEVQLGNVIDKDLREYVGDGANTAALRYTVDGEEYYCINNYETGMVQSNLREPLEDYLRTWSIPKKEGQITSSPTADVICKQAYTSFHFNDVFDDHSFEFGKLKYQYGYGGRYWDTDKMLTPDNASTIWITVGRDSDDRYLTVGSVSFIWRDKYGNDMTSAFKIDAEDRPCYPYTYPQDITFSASDK